MDDKNVLPATSMVTRGRTAGQGMFCMNPAAKSATLIPEGKRMSQGKGSTSVKPAEAYLREVLNTSEMLPPLIRRAT